MHRSFCGGLLLSFFLQTAYATDIYVCEKDGKKEFSQHPCGSNATIVKDNSEPSVITITNPMAEKDIARLCQLVIQAKDRYALATAFNNSRRYTRRGYNYNYNPSRDSNTNSPQAYVLSHISNLELLAGKSPRTYDMVKNLTQHVDYQGYDQSPIYQAERAAAMTECGEHVSQELASIADR